MSAEGFELTATVRATVRLPHVLPGCVPHSRHVTGESAAPTSSSRCTVSALSSPREWTPGRFALVLLTDKLRWTCCQERGRTSSTRCTISALPSPSATKTISLAALTTGMLKVMRPGGGVGEFAMDSTLHASKVTMTKIIRYTWRHWRIACRR